jgi:hypothetical protein
MQISVRESNRLGAPSTVAVSDRPAAAHKKTLLSGIIGSSGLSAALQERLHNNSSNSSSQSSLLPTLMLVWHALVNFTVRRWL